MARFNVFPRNTFSAANRAKPTSKWLTEATIMTRLTHLCHWATNFAALHGSVFAQVCGIVRLLSEEGSP